MRIYEGGLVRAENVNRHEKEGHCDTEKNVECESKPRLTGSGVADTSAHEFLQSCASAPEHSFNHQ